MLACLTPDGAGCEREVMRSLASHGVALTLTRSASDAVSSNAVKASASLSQPNGADIPAVMASVAAGWLAI